MARRSDSKGLVERRNGLYSFASDDSLKVAKQKLHGDTSNIYKLRSYEPQTSSQSLIITKEKGVLTIVFNRPRKKNAFIPEVIDKPSMLVIHACLVIKRISE